MTSSSSLSLPDAQNDPCADQDVLSSLEVASRCDDALIVALATPPKLNKDSKKKPKESQSK